jgi:hypothetical protein
MLFFKAKKSPPVFDNCKPLKVIIFSKDRACQLDVLLNSMREHLKYNSIDYTVLYTTSSDSFADAYSILQKIHSEHIRWLRECSFKSDLIQFVQSMPDQYPVMFLVDDDVFFRPVDIGKILQKFTESHLFVSLRVDRRYKRYDAPKFCTRDSIIEWNWKYCRKSLSTWHYPFSVDGNIFNSTVIKKILNEIDFKAPNTLEASMHNYRNKKWIRNMNRAIAPAEAVLFNNPMNKVQLEGETWHQNITAEFLNETFLSGQRIEYLKLNSSVPTGIHSAIPVSFRGFRNSQIENKIDKTNQEVCVNA